MEKYREIWALGHLAKLGDGHFIDDFIHMYTFPFTPNVPALSHYELGFPQRNESFSFTARDDEKIMYPGTCVEDGARFTDLKHMLRNHQRWIVHPIRIPVDMEEKLYQYCRGELGKRYGYGALVSGFLFYHGTDGKKANYCSRGGVAWPFHHVGLLKEKYKVISPRRLNRVLNERGFWSGPVSKQLVMSLPWGRD